ncbi:cellulose binding domain-containing protein [Thermomonospora amylolytica]|uniref:cellulose binding domain-containing protein n=1 Tax=Thermomonospora amylolytica TaxID=1411117 RepID=UPI0018E546E7|nr:cellulose binding domain-containing protein [Thermomonospora amylolytica]
MGPGPVVAVALAAGSLGHNAAIPPGGSTVIGFQATHDGNPAEPTAFTLNNTPCTTT